MPDPATATDPAVGEAVADAVCALLDRMFGPVTARHDMYVQEYPVCSATDGGNPHGNDAAGTDPAARGTRAA